MKKKIGVSLVVGIVVAAVVAGIGVIGSRPVPVSICDGLSIASVCLLAVGAIDWLNAGKAKYSIFDLSKSIFKKSEDLEIPTEDETRQKAQTGIACLAAGAILLLPAVVMMLLI